MLFFMSFTHFSDTHAEIWSERSKNDMGRASSEFSKMSLAPLVETLKPAVVNIYTTQVVKNPYAGNKQFEDLFKHFFGTPFENRPQKSSALGTGFIISKDGYVLTNNHVVQGATEIKAKTENEKSYTAKVIGTDPSTDIALIKLDTKDILPIAYLGDSSSSRIGDWVIAIGNPFGLSHTVTTGIVSSKGRTIGQGNYDDFIQTDASINPGNSGGPLFNLQGDVIGINTAIVASGQGIGFAIPINMAKEILTQLKDSGSVTRGWLGIGIQDISDEISESIGVKKNEGVLIREVVKKSPADNAGIQAGDIIISIDGKSMKTADQLTRHVAKIKPKTEIKISYIRNGKSKTVTAGVGKRPDSQSEYQREETEESYHGLSFRTLDEQTARRLGINNIEGVLIEYVKPESPADKANLKDGDIIIKYDSVEITNEDQLADLLTKSGPGTSHLVLVQRGGNNIFTALKIPK